MRVLGVAGPPLTKAEKQSRVKARRNRQQAARRKACLLIVYAREGMRCKMCRIALVLPFTSDQPIRWAQVHEKLPRSLGGSPYDPDNCELLCAYCHNEAQRVRKL